MRRWRIIGILLTLSLILAGATACNPFGGGAKEEVGQQLVEVVKDDLIDGFISERAAGEDYGVVVDVKTEKVDYEATKKLRAELSKKPRDGYDRHIGGLPSHKIGER